MASSGDILSLGQSQLGTPYQWGGASPGGFDCSGLVQWLYAQRGINVPRTTYEQIGFGAPVQLNQLLPGDVIFVGPTQQGPDHEVMYVGGGNVIEAPHTGETVRIESLSAALQGGLVGIRRFASQQQLGLSGSGTETLAGGAPYTSVMSSQAQLDMQTLAQDYGIAYNVLNAIPDLKKVFGEAVAGSWSTAKFTSELQNTEWYKSNSDSQRQMILLQKTDPATYRQNVQQKLMQIQELATAVGASLTPRNLNNLAILALSTNMSDEQITHALGGYIQMTKDGHFGGAAGQAEMNMRGLAANLGLSLTDQQVSSYATRIATGQSTLEDMQGFLRSQAASKYPAYAKDIQAGANLSDLAQQYVSTYNNTLEQSGTTLSNPTIQSALQYKDAQGNPAQLPVWQFEQMLKQDPRWQQTNNARESLMSSAKQVLSDFGFQQ